ncbi:ExbD/TolR family protein [Aureibaculum luteum]|uniref:ExbD/TolR family protein n=1 Tax=Aureibaculum luteum TaxID=1548456 RepID=UPI000E4F70FB|nr:biopolymer transporter ExbD [Aureibaculum luteum]
MSERNTPEVNAGSMADIAFLLLIFFLVTTTMDTDIGIYKRLPEKQTDLTAITLNEKNVLEININANDEILIEGDQIMKIENLKQVVVDFIDNGAGTNNKGNKCTWCNGKKDVTSSDHPEKAMISFQSKRNASYTTYISVQNEILSAYAQLRNDLSQSLYNKTFSQLETELKNNKGNKTLAENVQYIKAKYPQLITEQTPKK